MSSNEKKSAGASDRLQGPDSEDPDQQAAEREERMTREAEAQEAKEHEGEETSRPDAVIEPPSEPLDSDRKEENKEEQRDETEEEAEDVRWDDELQTEDDLFPIVGIGASAGGLEALDTFLSHVPAESGIAVVVISHTDPERASMLPDILRRKSRLEVFLVDEGMRPEPDRVYLPPSDKDLVIKDSVFHLEERKRRDGLHMPVDTFLRSLAEDRRDRAGCVILSGTGTDGTRACA